MTTADTERPTLHLLDSPYVSISRRRVAVPEGSKRLVALVALNERRVDRRYAADTLWPSADKRRAAGNLRSAIWRLRGAGLDILRADKFSLSLRIDLRVDLEEVCAWAIRVVEGTPERDDLDFRPTTLQALDLFPAWYDEWVLIERERVRQSLLDAIDALSYLLIKANRCAEAVEAALTSVGAEPLRESAQRVLIEAHLAEGNRCEAWRSYLLYERLLAMELGVAPPYEIARLLEGIPIRPAQARRRWGQLFHMSPVANMLPVPMTPGSPTSS